MGQIIQQNQYAIEQIKNYYIEHRNWNNAISEAFSTIACAMEGEVICITGPSRVGKTMLIKKLMKLLTGEDQYEETGLLPSIKVDATNCGQHGTFSTKTFTRRALEAIKHPLVTESDMLSADKTMMTKLERITEASLRIALEKGLTYRKTKYIFIDEAQHARYSPKSSIGAHAVLDSWKCLAQTCNLVLIMVGAYPLIEVMHNSPHMLGRKLQIHLPRYHVNYDDLLAFEEILNGYSKFIIFEDKNTSLRSYNELLYSGSLGCIGLLNSWLRRALAFSSINNTKLNEEILKKTILPDTDLEIISEEIYTGEKLMSPQEIKKDTTTNIKKNKNKTKKKTNKPFQQNPKRRTEGNRLKGNNDV